MSKFTNRYFLTSIQHVDLVKSRATQDTKDILNILEWFDQHDPFNVEVSSLKSVSSGLTATDVDIVIVTRPKSLVKNKKVTSWGIGNKYENIKSQTMLKLFQACKQA